MLRDLDGLDYVDLTGRTQKAMQLSHTVSLRKHYPVSFLTTELAEVAVPRSLFASILRRIDDLRPRPPPLAA